MRPKKVLLVVMPDPDLLSTLSFMLTTEALVSDIPEPKQPAFPGLPPVYGR